MLNAAAASGSTASTWSGPIPLSDATFPAEVQKPARADRLRLGKMNVDENPATPSRFGITSIPTMLLFKDGKLVDGIVGAVPKAEIEALLDRWA
ncbi:MAG: hypothetical protein E6J99_06510 [Methanobacteriota archaeon]|nr:MAG: hypothetical protein E6J99_06510 [Euryarchaeota archaeon]